MQKNLPTLHHYNTAMYVTYAVQLVMKAWNACRQAAELGSIQIRCKFMVFYSNWRDSFEFIGSREQGYSVQLQRMFYAVGDCMVVP